MKRSRVSPHPFPEEDKELFDVEHEDGSMDIPFSACCWSCCCCCCWSCLRCHRGITDEVSGVSKDMEASKPAMSWGRVACKQLVFIVSN